MNADLLAHPGLLLGAVLVFALAGVVKGVVGLGLPTVSMALLALFMPTGQAAAWLLLPSLVTNVLQMRPAASLGPVLRRLWPMQLGVVVGTLGGVWWWGPLGQAAGARTLLGAALALYALWGLWGRVVALPQDHLGWMGAVAGLVTGGITALTGVFVVPAVAYLQALQLPRQALMQAMGLSFTVSTLALGLGLSGVAGGSGPLDGAALGASAAMLLPALLGMAAGERLRSRLSATAFKRVLMGSLLALGAYILFN
ncbi:TSUP family transporter [Comamonas terrigena]|uniref:TSUP family transporter n=1 Tax=Comamonas terrigena TaxID=32013 RepID=UPI0028A64F7A|nr:TSUP family transporter [Comamonas terrigena]